MDNSKVQIMSSDIPLWNCINLKAMTKYPDTIFINKKINKTYRGENKHN